MSIELIDPITRKKLTESYEGLLDNGKVVYPFINGAYRIVQAGDYTSNFGFQWNKFTETQIDKSTNLELSRSRFFTETSWKSEELKSLNILEAGSGAGRFSQIVLDHTEANLYSIDYSNAVEANFRNNGPNPRLHLYQASLYELPFAPQQFDKVFCFGVLQHTPDVERSVQSLIDMVKPGGELVVDFYPIRGWWTKIHAKYLLRPYTKKMTHEKLYKKIDKNIDWLIKASKIFNKVGLRSLNRFLPICDIEGTLPKGLPPSVLREMVVLDTFDMFSPEYDQPQKIKTVVRWFEKYGMKNVWGGDVRYENSIASVVKGTKPD